MLLSFYKGGKRVGQTIAMIVAVLALAVMFGSMFFAIYEFAKINPEAGTKFINNLTALSFHGMFVFLCFWGLSMAVMHVFFSNDLDLLLTLPVKPRDIYIFKITEATFQNVRISILFLVPSLIILGIYHHAFFPYYIMALLAAVFMAAIPGSVGIIIASFLSRKIPRARLKGMLTVIGSLIGVTFWALFNRFSSRFSSSETSDLSLPIAKMERLTSSPIAKWLPSDWAYKAINAAAYSNWAVSLEYAAILLAVSFMLIYISLRVISRYYASGISEEIASPSASVASINMGGSPLVAHIRRDLILFLREPGVIVQSLIMLIFLLLFPYVSNRKQDLEIATGLAISPVSAIFAAFFGGQIGSRLIPLERMGFWQNLAFPNGRNLTLISKTIIGLVFVTVLVIPITLVHYFTGRVSDLTAIPISIAFAWAGLAIGLPLGIFFGNFNWEHPRRMLKGSGGFFYALIMMIGGAGMYGLYFVFARFLSSLISPIIPIFLVACAFLALSISITAVKLSNLEWNPEI